MQPVACTNPSRDPSKMYVLDQVKYTKQSAAASLADTVLIPLRVAFQGRIITCRGHKLHIELATHNLAVRALAGFAALLLLPLTLVAYLVKWICLDDIKRDLTQLIAQPHQDGDSDGLSIGNFLSADAPVTKLADFRPPLIDLEKREIEFYEFFNREDQQEVKAWVQKIGELIKSISDETGRRTCAFEYFGMGQGDYYYFDQEGKCRVTDSETLSYGNSPQIDYAKDQLFSEGIDTYTLLMPGRREALEHILNPQ